MKNHKAFKKPSAKLTGNERRGLVVATFGSHAEVEDENGKVIRCHVRKNIDTIITGDQVLWQPENDNSGVIVNHLSRKSLLCRPESSRRTKPIAANIESIIIVTAPPPVLSLDMIDRYLIAAEALKIQPIILLNKTDLLDQAEKEEIRQELECYSDIGYLVMYSSVYTDDGLVQLEDFLRGKTCVLVGASGVGKSSIIAALSKNPDIRIGDVSQSTQLGKHTTTNTRLYHLVHGGNLIDSPGVREFGLWNVSKQEIQNGFIEFKKFSSQCKFRDCIHHSEPNCAVQQAVAENKISERRFESYLEIMAEYV